MTKLTIAVLFTLGSMVLSHSYIARPVTRSNQAGSQRGELVGPCDSSIPQPTTPVKRGDAILLEWPRNNHPGGMIRVSWAPLASSNDPAAYRSYVQQYSCHEYPCNSMNQCNNLLTDPSGCTPCSLPVKIPAFLGDGNWTIQWVWYGGGYGLAPYYSCIDYSVKGGDVYSSVVPQPTYIPGDTTFTSTCWTCVGCAQSFDGGPTLAQLSAGTDVDIATRTPIATTVAGPTTTTSPTGNTSQPMAGCPAGFSGFRCTSDCSNTYFQCSSGVRYADQPVAPGTYCQNQNGIGVFVHDYECTLTSGTSSPATQSGSTTTASPSLPTSAPNNGGQNDVKPNCAAGANNIQCFPSNCCQQFYQCANGVSYPVQNVAPGTLCYGNGFVHTNDALCVGVTCGNVTNDHDPAPTPFCGDGMCQRASEDCTSCPSDCGVCPSVCGNGKCEGAETCATCRQDCGSCSQQTTANPVVPVSTSSSTVVPTNPTSGGYGKRMIGYYTNWAQYRSAAGGTYAFLPESLDGTLFTNVIYAFMTMDANFQIQPYEWNDILDWSPGMIDRFHKTLRAKNPSIKTSYAIGGWNFNAKPETSAYMTNILSSQANRAKFIASCIAFARLHTFDGVELDFEYPGDPDQGGKASDKINFTLLLAEFREAITQEAPASVKAPLLLSIASGCGSTTINNGYQVGEIYKYVDWVDLMSYDLRGSWSSYTGMHTQLTGADSIDTGVNLWLSGGMPPEKLILGMATYGRSWTLASASNTAIGAPAAGAGTAGYVTGEAGFLAYYEIQNMLATGGISVYDPASASAYAYKGKQWVSYDNNITISDKIDYLYSKSLGGAMVWAIDLDNFIQGYPLISQIAQELFVKGSQTVQVNLLVAESTFVAYNFRAAVASQLAIPLTAVRITNTKDLGGNQTSVGVVILEDYASSRSSSSSAVQLGINACGRSLGYPVQSATTQDGLYSCGTKSSALTSSAVTLSLSSICLIVAVLVTVLIL
jgi:chitinase